MPDPLHHRALSLAVQPGTCASSTYTQFAWREDLLHETSEGDAEKGWQKYFDEQWQY